MNKELEAPPATTPRPTNPSQFDISKHIKFVPPFKVDKHFLHYEKIATSLECMDTLTPVCFNRESP